jgi:hypothetical protein
MSLFMFIISVRDSLCDYSPPGPGKTRYATVTKYQSSVRQFQTNTQNRKGNFWYPNFIYFTSLGGTYNTRFWRFLCVFVCVPNLLRNLYLFTSLFVFIL